VKLSMGGSHGELTEEGKEGEGQEEAGGAAWGRRGELLEEGEGRHGGCRLLVRGLLCCSWSLLFVRRRRQQGKRKERKKKRKGKKEKIWKISEK
jgi:hypothetical protein